LPGAGVAVLDPDDWKAFQHWLASNPSSWSVVMAARAASRVLPLISPGEISAGTAEMFILPVFRATAIARFAAVFPERAIGTAAADSARAAAAAAAAADDASVAYGARSAIAAAAAAAAAVTRRPLGAAATAAAEASSSATSAASAASAISAAIRNDGLELGDGRRTPKEVGRSELWPTGVANRPQKVADAWSKMSAQLRALGNHWQVWIAWYEEVLAGSPPSPERSEAWEMAFTDVEETLPWKDLAAAVNTEIAARLAKLVTPIVPAQSLAPVRVEERSGKIALVTDRDSPLRAAERDFDAWRAPVIDHIEELTLGDFRQGTNHSRARDRLVALERFVSGPIEEVKEQQFRIGYEIERLDGLMTAYRSGADDMPVLSAATLEDLSRLLIALKMGVDKLERWSEFRQRAIDDPSGEGSANREAVADASEKIADEMERRPNYFHPDLPRSFRFLAEAVRDPLGATKVIVYGAVKSAENLFAFLGQTALGIGKKAVEGVEGGISKGVATSLLLSLSGAALELSGAFPQGWAWLKPLLESLTKIIGGG
jgi:hypothetical protein